LGHGGVVTHRREQLHVGLGHLQQRFLDTVALHHLAVFDLDAIGVAVVLDGGLEVVDRDGDMVDLGEHHQLLRNRGIWSRWAARSSGSVTPRPSSGASTNTPSLPSCWLWCTCNTASATCSNGNTAESTGWMRPSATRRLASHASR